jgi:folate-binding protein YgfZ
MSELPYKTISVSGSDAFEFLQSQLTNDLRLLGTPQPFHGHIGGQDCGPSGSSILSAWCNPKGRVIWFGTVFTTENSYSMSVAADMAEEVVQRLTVFRFRSKVEFTIGDGGTVDPKFLISIGCPFIASAQSELFTPHMLNLDLLGAVSIDKGCYPGQEVVARTHYRGATKRRLMRFESAARTKPGDKVSDGERDVGEVVNASDNELLAVVPLNKADQQLTVDGAALVNSPLPYLQK